LLSARLSALDCAMETFRGGKVAPRRVAEPAQRLGGLRRGRSAL
jgi:hypothetical protein